MSTPSIYGEYAQYLPKILQEITDPIIAANITSKKETGFKLYEHFISVSYTHLTLPTKRIV